MPAEACQEVLAVAYVGSDAGKLTIRVNDVTLISGLRGALPNFVPPSLLLEGENHLTLELDAEDATANVRAEVFKGCRGEFPGAPGENRNVLAQISLEGTGARTVSFPISGLPDYSYLSAAPSDDKGLLDAIEAMRDAARHGDVDGYLAYFQPMLDDFVLDGEASAAQLIRGMVSQLLGDGFTVADSGDLTVRPVLGGRVFQVEDGRGDGPMQFRPSGAGGDTPDKIAQASFWINTGDGWKVLRQ